MFYKVDKTICLRATFETTFPPVKWDNGSGRFSIFVKLGSALRFVGLMEAQTDAHQFHSTKFHLSKVKIIFLKTLSVAQMWLSWAPLIIYF